MQKYIKMFKQLQPVSLILRTYLNFYNIVQKLNNISFKNLKNNISLKMFLVFKKHKETIHSYIEVYIKKHFRKCARL